MEKPRISLIAAIGATTRALGVDGGLVFQIPEDLKRFKSLTKGHPVIMGRKTWESLPPQFRPLPGRTNFVVSRNADYEAAGATACASLDEALALAANAEGADEVFVMGGAEIYTLALPKADRLYLTLVESDAAADTFFPEYGQFSNVIEDKSGEGKEPPYRFVTLER